MGWIEKRGLREIESKILSLLKKIESGEALLELTGDKPLLEHFAISKSDVERPIHSSKYNPKGRVQTGYDLMDQLVAKYKEYFAFHQRTKILEGSYSDWLEKLKLFEEK